MEKKCQTCGFLRVLLVGGAGATVGLYLTRQFLQSPQAGLMGAAFGALAALVLARRWLR